MTLVIASKSSQGLVVVADTVVYRGLVLLESFPIRKIRPSGNGVCLGFAGMFNDEDETYSYFMEEIQRTSIREAYERLRKEGIGFAGTRPCIGGHQYLFAIATEGNSEILVGTGRGDLRSLDFGIIGYQEVPPEIQELLGGLDPDMDRETVQARLVNVLETAQELSHSESFSFRGSQVCILSHEEGFQELSFVEP